MVPIGNIRTGAAFPLWIGGISSVTKPLFRERAATCLRVARSAKQPQNKAVLLRIALLWYELARQHEPASDDANTARRNYLEQEEK